ncbi:hypothetical protein KRIGEM_03534 [Komagataeibacter rhaeticus]|nr:hypothetical protein KRIGEM_03516 [Komagataeibacter rhaeticus]SAY46988.1 hypothetical protein KRIGEM_03565 [Komagataeibacter rhaeticus]SAY47001.1 hypothetical protein KRIGEM_03317 [Komagataeibacter rhaeticus]SAY47022.1 hypothetical protein KRIGEM_03338 [Komagataeibacter rhaeticus]SAY47027.1 hypothetical protein KRIGEM_03534 [Komagataeibacter rhaeticus]
MGLLLCKMLLHDPPGGGMCPRVGDIRAPDVELGVEVIEIMEAAAKEEVLTDVAEGSLDLALGLGAIGLAGSGGAAIMGQKRHQRGIVGHHARIILTDDSGLHAIVENFRAAARHRLEGGDVATHHCFQTLVRAETSPQPATVPQHHAEQPDLAHDAWLAGEDCLEFRKIDLRLNAGSGLEAPLIRPGQRGADLPEIFRQR